jgi:hypothetical protein
MRNLFLRILPAILLLSQLPATAAASDERRLSFTVEAAPWMLTFPAADFKVAQRQFKPDGRSAYFMLNDNKSNLNVSFFIEPVQNCNSSKACRDMVWKLGNPSWENPQNFSQSQLGDIYYFEFLIPSFRGQPIKQQNMYAEFVVDGYWVDLHISKVLYESSDHRLFEELVKSIKFDAKSKATARN